MGIDIIFCTVCLNPMFDCDSHSCRHHDEIELCGNCRNKCPFCMTKEDRLLVWKRQIEKLENQIQRIRDYEIKMTLSGEDSE